ncbi:hypothetical protein CDAR_297951 [Caerostris darwini]|uniref:Uncharacterized protein n=1 Tax=Caerostris darwini TaxID=1538125 RepID=A0AAV4PQ64_9ARAC|nr:hypothetical protein CDAR_297951 [Caerostris darwini]
MPPIREYIGFAAHCNFVQTKDGPMPVEIALATLWERSTTVLTVNDQDNKNRSRIGRPLPFGYPGKYTYREAIAQVWERYAEKDKGLGWWVAVIGDTQQDFFESCGLPVMDMNTLWKCPQYEKLPTPDRPLLKRCTAIHLDDSSCSKRMAYNLARYLESRAKEEEIREYSIVDFKNADDKPVAITKNSCSLFWSNLLSSV